MSDELKECPFCGELPLNTDGEINYVQDQGYKWGHIECGCHEVRTDYQDWPYWKDDAIKAWNTRHPGKPSGEANAPTQDVDVNTISRKVVTHFMDEEGYHPITNTKVPDVCSVIRHLHEQGYLSNPTKENK